MEPNDSSGLPTSSSQHSDSFVLDVRPIRPLPPRSWFRPMPMRGHFTSNNVPSVADYPSSHLRPSLWSSSPPLSMGFNFHGASFMPSSHDPIIYNVPCVSFRLPQSYLHMPNPGHGSNNFAPSFHGRPAYRSPHLPRTQTHYGDDFPPFTYTHAPFASGAPPPVRTYARHQVPTGVSPPYTSSSSSSHRSSIKTEAPDEHFSYGRVPSQVSGRRPGGSADTILSNFNDKIGNEDANDHKAFIEVGSSNSSSRTQLPLTVPSALTDRESVERTLMIYHAIRRRLLQADEAQRKAEADRRVKRFHSHLRASTIMNEKGLRVNEEKRIGTIPGVQVGDIYYYRMEMCIVGLHSPTEAGIDYMTTRFDQVEESVAISIVTSSGHEGDVDDGEVLIYSGHGGHKKGKKFSDDQKLERGNLALDRSMQRGIDIRVTRGLKDPNHSTRKVYIYDGLYKIFSSWMEKNNEGFNVYKYKLVRQPGQPTLGSLIWKLSQRWKEYPSYKYNAVTTDISVGREKKPICLVNEVDNQQGLPPFVYITKLRRAGAIRLSRPPCSCKCIDRCLPCDIECDCIEANSNEFPYVDNGTLVRRIPAVFECGTSCSCSLDCPNRVSQQGVAFHFEIFKTEGRGWGLRSWDLIPAGAFICEYAGEVTTRERVHETGDDEYVFDSGRVSAKWFEWEGMYELLGEPRPMNSSMEVEPVAVVIDARRAGNLSRFMNHSCSPNVFWQLVVYDESGLRYPHVVFFAMKNIPPLTELTFDYGTSKRPEDKGGGDDGNGWEVGGKECLCGAPNCRGRFG